MRGAIVSYKKDSSLLSVCLFGQLLDFQWSYRAEIWTAPLCHCNYIVVRGGVILKPCQQDSSTLLPPGVYSYSDSNTDSELLACLLVLIQKKWQKHKNTRGSKIWSRPWVLQRTSLTNLCCKVETRDLPSFVNFSFIHVAIQTFRLIGVPSNKQTRHQQ